MEHNTNIFKKLISGSLTKRITVITLLLEHYFSKNWYFACREKPNQVEGWGGADTHTAFAMCMQVDFELLVTGANGDIFNYHTLLKFID